MKIRVADSAGFCFGVSRAVKMAFNTQNENNVYTLGPIIHNPQIIKQLEDKGIKKADNLSEIPNETTLIVRSHGVGKSVYENISKKNLKLLDATCPFVKKIHEIVEKASADGNDIIIIGDKNHPEVKGIVGYCKNSYVFDNFNDLKSFLEERYSPNDTFTMVAQTTLNVSEYQKCTNFVKNCYTNAQISDTICYATAKRQQEAIELSKSCDAVFVVGGRESSNTTKLFQVCKANLDRCYHIESALDIGSQMLDDVENVGITAGASTPDSVIKEVISKMEEIKNNEELSFEEEIEKSLLTLNTGDRVKGIVSGISPIEVYVDLGTKQTAYIPLDELTDDPNAKINDIVKVGDEIEVFVVRVNDVEGMIKLSKKKIDSLKGWDNIVKAGEDNSTLNATVVEVVKGGVIGTISGVRLFIPASQTTVPRDGDLSTLINKSFDVKIIEVNERRHRALASIRAVAKDARKESEEKFWASAAVGQTIEGVVKSLTSYGAFVDIGGVDGMVHISELSWNRLRHPSEVLQVGDLVKVTIKELDTEKKRISLSFNDRGENPWDNFKTKYNVGDVVKVKILKYMPFGVFAEIMPGIDGLIHISQISDKRIVRPSDELKIGQEVQVKITEINIENKRISLSIRALSEPVAAPEVETTSEVSAEPVVVAESVGAESVEKPKRARKPKAEVTEEVVEKPKRTRKPKAETTEEVVEKPKRTRKPKAETTEETAEKPKRTRKAKTEEPKED